MYFMYLDYGMWMCDLRLIESNYLGQGHGHT